MALNLLNSTTLNSANIFSNLISNSNNNLNTEFKISNSKITEREIDNFLKHISKIKDTPTFDGSTMKNDKEFNKNLVRCYKKLCKIAIEKSSDYNFLRADFYLSIPQLDEILLNLMFNKTLSSQDIIKYIKGLDIELGYVIIIERILMSFYTVQHNNTEYEDSEELIRLTILLNTLVLIKCIKFGLSKYDINYFDKDLNPKKIYKGLKIVSCDLGLISIIDSKSDIYKDISNHIRNLSGNDSFNSNEGYDLVKFYDYISEHSASRINQLSNCNILFSLDYLKLLFTDSFKSILNLKSLVPHEDMLITLISSKLFFNRKILIPKSGVILLVKNHPFIESILIKEKYLDDTNNIVYITRFKDGTEIPNIAILQTDLGQDYPQLIVDSRLNDEIRISHYIFHFLNVFKEGVEDITLVEYDVISPSYWKYRNKNYISQNDTLRDGIVVKREFEVEIAPYLRKINGEPSKEAKALAKKLCISLEEGYTIVKPHTRVYNKVK